MKGVLQRSINSPKYLLLADYFREQIQSGALKPGDRLPSFAQMQARHGIGQGTLERTYSLLENERIIVREANKGTFVAESGTAPPLGIVGVVSNMRPKECPYYRHLLEGIQDVAYQEQIEILLLHSGSSVNWDKMDGVISFHQDIHLPPSLPAVNLVVPTAGRACVMADDYGGARTATQHLMSLGHRQIAFLVLGGHEPADFVVRERISGYHDAFNMVGLYPNPRWLRLLRDPLEKMAPFRQLGYEKMTHWLHDGWGDLGCTAILAHNDDVAAGVLQALGEAGLHVPEDVSVVGFDGTEVADRLHPRLTTVSVPLEEIGARGMRLLMRKVNTHTANEAAEHEIVPTRLRIQDSTGVVRA